MKFLRFSLEIIAAAFLWNSAASAQTGYPFQNETLRYSLNWPSGLSLGDATFTARKGSAGWTFDLSIDAAIPGSTIADKYHSGVTTQICSTELDRTISHGTH